MSSNLWFEAPDWPRGSVKYVQINETAQEIWYGLPREVLAVGASKLVLRQLLDLCVSELKGKRIERPEWTARLQAVREKSAARRRELGAKYANQTPIHTFELTDVLANMVDDDATVIYDSYSGLLYLTDAVQSKFAGQVLDAGPRVALGQGVGIVADCDGVEYSQAWLPLKSGDMFSRGLNEISPETKRHFDVSPLNALRIRKSAEDNGTRIPLSFIADLTNNDLNELERVAEERHYKTRGQ